MANPRLDKSHGFMKLIVQNQIDRLQFEEKERVLRRSKSNKPKAVQYTSRYQSQTGEYKIVEENEKSPMDISEAHLEVVYVPKSGDAVKLLVYQDFSIDNIVREISKKANMNSTMEEALYQRLTDEFQKY